MLDVSKLETTTAFSVFLYNWQITDVLSVRAKLQNASTVDVDMEFSIQILGDGNGYLPLLSYSKPPFIVDFQLLWLAEGRQMLRAPNHLTHAQIPFLRTLAQVVPNVEVGHGTRSWEKHPEKTSILGPCWQIISFLLATWDCEVNTCALNRNS